MTREAVVSDRRSDWDFLKARAAVLGWVVYVRGDSLVMRPPATASNPPRLDYTRDLIEVHLTEDITRAIDYATGVAWDVSAQEAAESEQGASSAGIDSGSRKAPDAAIGDAGWPLRAARDETPADVAAEAADARAVARQRDAALAHGAWHRGGQRKSRTPV